MTTRIFTLNPNVDFSVVEGKPIIQNRELPGLISSAFQEGKAFLTQWRCNKIKDIQVGDKAYFWKTTDKPTGFVMAGEIIKAPADKQTKKLTSEKCSEIGLDPKKCPDLSLAYYYVSKDEDKDDYEYQQKGYYLVYIAIDSVIDFDYPLPLAPVQSRVPGKKVTFAQPGGGGRLSKDDPEVAAALDATWQVHIQQHRNFCSQYSPNGNARK